MYKKPNKIRDFSHFTVLQRLERPDRAATFSPSRPLALAAVAARRASRSRRMDKNFSGSQRRSGGAAVEPLAVGPKTACILADVGLTRLYQLLNAGELDSYWEGRHRKITVESIRRRQERKIAEARQAAEAKAATKAEPSAADSAPRAAG
jgi:hypothetical protein